LSDDADADEGGSKWRHGHGPMRVFMSSWMIGGGLLFIFAFKNYTLSGLIPVPWVGYLLLAVGVLGLLGVNVFRGGPIDQRLDRDAG